MDQCECGHDKTRHNHLVGVGYVGRCIAPMCPCGAWRKPLTAAPDPLTAARDAVVETAKAWVTNRTGAAAFFAAVDALLAAEAAAGGGK